MGINDEDFKKEFTKIEEIYKAKAAAMMVDAFNQGYELGQEYYKSQFERDK